MKWVTAASVREIQSTTTLKGTSQGTRSGEGYTYLNSYLVQGTTLGTTEIDVRTMRKELARQKVWQWNGREMHTCDT